MDDAEYRQLRSFVMDRERDTGQRITHQELIRLALAAYYAAAGVRSGDQQQPEPPLTTTAARKRPRRKPAKEGKKPIQRRGTSIPISAAELEAAGGDKRRAYRARRAQKKQQKTEETQS